MVGIMSYNLIIFLEGHQNQYSLKYTGLYINRGVKVEEEHNSLRVLDGLLQNTSTMRSESYQFFFFLLDIFFCFTFFKTMKHSMHTKKVCVIQIYSLSNNKMSLLFLISQVKMQNIRHFCTFDSMHPSSVAFLSLSSRGSNLDFGIITFLLLFMFCHI